MHPLLRKHFSKAVGADGAVDLDRLTALVSAAYDRADKARRRTDRSITLMTDELAQINEQLEAKAVQRAAELEATRRTLSAALENVDQGIAMIGADDRLHVCNRRACQLLGLPVDIADKRPTSAEVLGAQIASEEFVGIDPALVELWRRTPLSQFPPVYERRRPNGTLLEIRTVTLTDGGCVRTFTDITERREREAQIARAEADHRSLFENAVIGIYRSSVDGRKMMRANPALVRLNGYESEAELLAEVNDIGAEWYVDPNRGAEFRTLMDKVGRVDDFVSEIHRHRTRERIWVSESAWLVRSPSGEPLYYEGTVIDSSERVLAEARVAHMAHYDALTDLATRNSFLDSLRAALRQDRTNGTVAVHCIDLDRFKDVNDTMGHPAGDQLLRIAAKRLRGALRGGRDIARLGGDEFAVMQRDVADRADAEALAARLVRILSAPYRIDGVAIHIGASLGVIVATESGVTAEELMKNVDIALYRAKADGRSTYRVFDPSMSEAAQRRRALEIDLRGAVANNELVAYLQPIVDIASGGIIAFEALLRWRHPERGMMSPGEFISIAEETGLIGSIGEWVLFEACAEAARSAGSFTISVNLSPAQFRTRRVVKAVKGALSASGLSASRLVLEITESVLLMDDDQTKAALGELRGLGVRFALDDFGTGHSSLSYLQKFSFDTIKIDRSFVGASDADQVNATLVRAVVSLGRELGIAVVAEGIETEEQRDKLAAQGCRYAQGYLFGRPGPAREWIDRLDPTQAPTPAFRPALQRRSA
jgi:diguanylate cyclase (GGDEF)-like protein/PAS domain S-box-containing protein